MKPQAVFLRTGQGKEDRAREFQSNSLNEVLTVPFLNGILLEDLVLASGVNLVAHKLARKPQGYLILKQNAAATFFSNPAASVDQALFLSLNASAAVTINLWVW